MNEKVLQHMEHQIELKDFKLNSLLEITTAINLNKDVCELTRLFEFIVKEWVTPFISINPNFEITRSSIFPGTKIFFQSDCLFLLPSLRNLHRPLVIRTGWQSHS